MKINQTVVGEQTTMDLEGRLDTLTSPVLQKAILDTLAITQALVLDFSGLSYVSSAGLRALLIGQKSAKAAGKSMTLVNVSPEIMELLQMTGIAQILDIEV